MYSGGKYYGECCEVVLRESKQAYKAAKIVQGLQFVNAIVTPVLPGHD
jgi:hypothetical protein